MKKILFILFILFFTLSCEEDTYDVCETNIFIINEKHNNIVVQVYLYDDNDLLLGATIENVVKNETLEFFKVDVIICRVRVFETINNETYTDSYIMNLEECNDNTLYLN